MASLMGNSSATQKPAVTQTSQANETKDETNLNQNVTDLVDNTDSQTTGTDFAGDYEAPVNRPSADVKEDPFKVYRHKIVNRFQVGGFEFVNHLLFIWNEDQNDAFLNLYDSLLEIDRNNIVEYNWAAASKMEKPVGSSAVRGSLATSGIKDPKLVQ